MFTISITGSVSVCFSHLLERCKGLLLPCPIYIGILGPFYGTVNEDIKLSYTEYEYIIAKEDNKEIAIFILPDNILNASPTETIIDQSSLMVRQQDFKNRVKSSNTTRPVTNLEDFENHLKQYLRGLNLPTDEVPFFIRKDWGFSPDVSVFFDRNEEITTLTRWMVEDRCRLVAIVGIRGIGKTDLSLKIAHSVENDFQYIIWRKLLNAPPLTEILADMIKFLSDQQEIKLPESEDEQISRLIYHLQSKRCLLILDNVEVVLRSGGQTGVYQVGYEGYGELFRRIGITPNQSCLLLNSREMPKEIAVQEGRTRPVRSLYLRGLNEFDGKKIFEEIGSYVGSDEEWKELIDLYNGNPFALELVAKHIDEVFFGNISLFLREGRPLFHELYDLLDWHFDRLSDLENDILYWLAIDREPVSFSLLEEDILLPSSKQKLSSTLQSIQRRIPLEKSAERFTLQPILIEYMTAKLTEHVTQEILAGEFRLLNSHALLKALAKDYVRETQIRLILKPIKDMLVTEMGSEATLALHLDHLLSELREKASQVPSYSGGNIINLLCQLNIEFRGNDFSHLTVWQAYLQHVKLYEVNLAYSNLKNCVFTQAFGPISSHAFSPDGKLLAASESNGNIHVWRVDDFQILLTLRGHMNWIFALSFSPDGRTLASGGEDKTVRLWDIESGKCLRIFQGHTNSVWAVAFSPNSQILATGGEDEAIIIWDLNDGRLLSKIQEHERKVFTLDFSSDGLKLASGSGDKTIKIWKVGEWKNLITLLGHNDTIRGVAFSPDNQQLASCSWDHTIKIWDIHSGNCLITFSEHDAIVHSVAFHPNGNILASSDEDGIIRIWDIQTKKCLETLKAHVGEVWKVAFTRDGDQLASGGYDGILKIWDTHDWRCRQTLQGYIDWVQALALSPDGKFVASSNADLTIRIWDISSAQSIKKIYGHTGWAFSVAFSADGKRLASGSDDRTIKIWDTRSWECLSILEEHSNWVQTVAFSPDDQLIASGSDDRTVKIWNVSSGTCLQTFEGHSEGIWSVVFSSDGEFLASGSEDCTIKIWNVRTGECLKTLSGHADRIHSVSFSTDGNLLASCSDDKTVRIWDVNTGTCLHTLEGHSSWVISCAFSPNGQLVASGSKDKTVRIWDVLHGGCLHILEGHSEGIWSVAYTYNGKTIASASEDGSIRLWDVDTGACLKTLRQIKPYEGLNITGVTGLTEAEKESLKILGAIDQ